MKFLALAASALIAATPAFAQSSASGAAPAAGATHTVTVGKSGLAFDPPSLNAAVGDVVSFVYYAKNHTVTQSTFANPCALLQNATTNAVGFDSGYVPVAANATSNPVWSIQVTATTPIWFYCKQGTHCQAGMVGAINAPAQGNTFDKFLAAAKGATGAAQTASGNPSGGPGASASAGVTGGDSGSTTGAAAHVVLSSAALVAAGILAVVAGLA